MPRLSIALLGSLQVALDGELLTAFHSDKERALLAYLALEADRPYRREALAALLWGELPEEAALNNVRKALHRLRQVLGDDDSPTPFLITSPKTIQFNAASDYELDTAVFTRCLAQTQTHPHRHIETCQACQSALESAAGVYRGDLLQGFTLPACIAFDEWLLIRREQLRLRALEVFHHLTAYHERRGQFDHAQQYALRLLELDPLREEAHRQIMTILARNGQRTAALTRYEACRRLLADELAVEPEAETLALYEKIKRGDSWEAVASPALHLPASTTPFFGRDSECARLRGWLENPAYRLLTLVGPGGVGKTRLALQVASDLLFDFEDGVYFVALASVRDPNLVASAIAQALGLKESGGQPIAETIKTTLRAKETLLLFDNFEHLLEAAPLVADLLRHCPRLAVVATSREALRLTGEQEFPVPPLAVPSRVGSLEAVPLENLLEYGSVGLFVQRAQAVWPDFALTSENAEAVVEICRRLDGLPLAIELAAARIKRFIPAQLLGQFEAASTLHLLTEGARDLPLRQQTMRATIAWSYDLLDETEQRLFWQLAIFVGGCTRPAVEAVCQSALLLASLVDKGLVQQMREGDDDRFLMLETIREYAFERLSASAETAALNARHAQHFCQLVEQASSEFSGPNQGAWLNRLELEHANLRAALGWAISEKQADLALRMVGILWRFWDMRGHLSEGRRWLEAALALPSADVPALVRARALNGSGMLAWYQGAYDLARERMAASLELSREIDDSSGMAVALNNLGMVAWSVGDYDSAQARYRDCLALDEAAGDQMGMAYSYGNLGLVVHHQGNYVQARAYFERCLNIFRELQNARHEAFALHNLGMTVYHQNDHAGAQALFEESLRIKESLGDKWGIATTLVYLANITRTAGDLARTRALLRQSLALRLELGDLSGVADTLDGLAALAVAEAHYERAARLFGAAETIRADSNTFLHAADRIERDRNAARLRECYSAIRLAEDWAEGRAMPFEQAVAYALEP